MKFLGLEYLRPTVTEILGRGKSKLAQLSGLPVEEDFQIICFFLDRFSFVFTHNVKWSLFIYEFPWGHRRRRMGFKSILEFSHLTTIIFLQMCVSTAAICLLAPKLVICIITIFLVSSWINQRDPFPFRLKDSYKSIEHSDTSSACPRYFTHLTRLDIIFCRPRIRQLVMNELIGLSRIIC